MGRLVERDGRVFYQGDFTELERIERDGEIHYVGEGIDFTEAELDELQEYEQEQYSRELAENGVV